MSQLIEERAAELYGTPKNGNGEHPFDGRQTGPPQFFFRRQRAGFVNLGHYVRIEVPRLKSYLHRHSSTTCECRKRVRFAEGTRVVLARDKLRQLLSS